MGCIQTGRTTIISVNPHLETNYNKNNLTLTLHSPNTKKRST